MVVFRLSKRRAWQAAFDGGGAVRVAGRWNPRGLAVVYTSGSLALAALEVQVHADPHQLRTTFYAFRVDVPDALLERPALEDLPADWRAPRRSTRARSFGADWARSRRSLALRVPSVVIPTEFNLILNPAHPDFARLTFPPPTPFHFDRRLWVSHSSR